MPFPVRACSSFELNERIYRPIEIQKSQIQSNHCDYRLSTGLLPLSFTHENFKTHSFKWCRIVVRFGGFSHSFIRCLRFFFAFFLSVHVHFHRNALFLMSIVSNLPLFEYSCKGSFFVVKLLLLIVEVFFSTNFFFSNCFFFHLFSCFAPLPLALSFQINRWF